MCSQHVCRLFYTSALAVAVYCVLRPSPVPLLLLSTVYFAFVPLTVAVYRLLLTRVLTVAVYHLL